MLLPQPLAPTKAAEVPAGTVKETACKTCRSGRDGYAKDTSSKRTSISMASGRSPSVIEKAGSLAQTLWMRPSAASAMPTPPMAPAAPAKPWRMAMANIMKA